MTTSSQGDEGSQSDNLVDRALRFNDSTSSVANTGDKGEDLSTDWDSDVYHKPIREDDSYGSTHLYFWTRIPCGLYDRHVKEGRWKVRKNIHSLNILIRGSTRRKKKKKRGKPLVDKIFIV